jgi:hypothetical protein
MRQSAYSESLDMFVSTSLPETSEPSSLPSNALHHSAARQETSVWTFIELG